MHRHSVLLVLLAVTSHHATAAIVYRAEASACSGESQSGPSPVSATIPAPGPGCRPWETGTGQAVAGVGTLGTRVQGAKTQFDDTRHTVFAYAEFTTDFSVTSSLPNPISIALNFDFTGSVSLSGGGLESEAANGFSIELTPLDGGRDAYIASGGLQLFNDPVLAPGPYLTGMLSSCAASTSVSCAVSTPTFSIRPNTRYSLRVALASSFSTFLGSGAANAFDTFKLPTGRAFMTGLPAGYSLNIPELNVVDNFVSVGGGGAVPEPSTWISLTAGLLGCAYYRRRR
jgi:hypothetical protein